MFYMLLCAVHRQGRYNVYTPEGILNAVTKIILYSATKQSLCTQLPGLFSPVENHLYA